MGMVFQSYALWPHMTVFENVVYPLKLRGMRGAEAEKQSRQCSWRSSVLPDWKSGRRRH